MRRKEQAAWSENGQWPAVEPHDRGHGRRPDLPSTATPEAFWYWLQIACTAENDNCDPAPLAGP